MFIPCVFNRVQLVHSPLTGFSATGSATASQKPAKHAALAVTNMDKPTNSPTSLPQPNVHNRAEFNNHAEFRDAKEVTPAIRFGEFTVTVQRTDPRK